MPNVFATFERTELIAFLSTNGPTNRDALAKAFNVLKGPIAWRLQAAQRSGLTQRTTSARPYRTYNRINPKHPAYREIVALGKKLADLFTLPSASEGSKGRRFTWAATPRTYDILNVLTVGRTLPTRGEVLLFLAAVGEAVPISRLSGALSRARFSVLTAVNALESYRIVISVRDKYRRLIQLNEDWEAYPEMLRLLRRLNKLDGTYAELAAAYRDAGGKVVYYW